MNCYESFLFDDHEKHWGFPCGSLSQGRTAHFPSDANMTVWTAFGGVVACRSGDVAEAISEAVAAHAREERDVLQATLSGVLRQQDASMCCSMDIGLSCAEPPAIMEPNPVGPVKALSPEDLSADENDWFEHVYAVKDGTAIVARATSRVSLVAGDKRFHAIGVGTHPNYTGRGLAKAVVSSLVGHIVAEGGVALWNCDATNKASLAVARAAGFIEYLWILQWQPADRTVQSEPK